MSKRLHQSGYLVIIWFLVFTLGTAAFGSLSSVSAAAARQAEKLNRGLVAVKVSSGVFVSWRLLGTEELSVSFNLYRNGTKVNVTPITDSTNYQDNAGTASSSYTVRAIVGGIEQSDSPAANVW